MVLRNVLPTEVCFTYVTQDISKSCVQHIWNQGAENLQHAQILCSIIQVLVESLLTKDMPVLETDGLFS